VSVPVKCDSCGKPFRVQDHFVGKRIRCPFCSTPLTVSAPRSLGDEDVLPAGYRRCPACSERIRNEARKCRFCGEDVEPLTEVSVPPRPEDEWTDLTPERLDMIEDGSNPFDDTTARKARRRAPPPEKTLPPEHRERRRELKKYIREVGRLGDWAEVTEFSEVCEIVLAERTRLLATLRRLVVEAKEAGAVEEILSPEGEVLYRFTGDDQMWTPEKL